MTVRWTVNRRLVALIDVIFWNEEDFHAALGYEIFRDRCLRELDRDCARSSAF